MTRNRSENWWILQDKENHCKSSQMKARPLECLNLFLGVSRNLPSIYPPRSTIKHWLHYGNFCARVFFPKLLLVELLRDCSANDPGIESTNIYAHQGSEWFGSSVRLHHVPKNQPFPLCFQIIDIFPPQITRHLAIINRRTRPDYTKQKWILHFQFQHRGGNRLGISQTGYSLENGHKKHTCRGNL